MKHMIFNKIRNGFMSSEKGDMTIMMAFLVTSLLIVSAFTVDIGAAYVKIAEAQNALDAAALAAGQLLPVSESDSSAIEEVYNTANSYLQKNGFNDFSEDDVCFSGSGGYYTSLTISTAATAKTYFSTIIGISQISSEKSASVGTYATGRVSGAVPFGIDANAFTFEQGYAVPKAGGGGGENGVFGYIALDGTSTNANAVKGWIANGFDGENYVGQILPLATGNMASAVKSAIPERINSCTHFEGDGGCNASHFVFGCPRVVIVPVYETIDTRTIRIIGFTAFILEGCTNQAEVYGTYVRANIPSIGGEAGGIDFGCYSICLID
ncbi:MAG: pilus assembly protein TadG-related protein [Oscillospiraceae bacterium]|nr:pilus assembly protein TadG-related protein [Oscillospiraceae bacterium]